MDDDTSDPFDLTGKVALITGAAGPDIGQTTARRLAARGATVVITDRSQRRLEQVGKDMAAEFGDRVVAVHLDLLETHRIAEVVQQVEASHGPLEILINNAGVTVFAPLDELEESDWDNVMVVNLKAAWLAAKAAIPGMKKLGRGSIVNVTSLAAYSGGWKEGVYGAAKAGLQSLTRDLASELGPFGIRCNCVAPGILKTKWTDAHWELYSPALEKTPLGRFPTALDVAKTIEFLVSDNAASITGEVVNVSSGWYMTP